MILMMSKSRCNAEKESTSKEQEENYSEQDTRQRAK